MLTPIGAVPCRRSLFHLVNCGFLVCIRHNVQTVASSCDNGTGGFICLTWLVPSHGGVESEIWQRDAETDCAVVFRLQLLHPLMTERLSAGSMQIMHRRSDAPVLRPLAKANFWASGEVKLAKQTTLNTRWLETFVAVAEIGKQTAVAADMGRHQATVHRDIGRLKEWLGGTLLFNGNVPAELSPAGEAFLPVAKAKTLSAALGA